MDHVPGKKTGSIARNLMFLSFSISLLHTSISQTCNTQQSTTAYFNGSTSALINSTFSFQNTTFSFQTCLGGILLQQNGSSGDYIGISADVSKGELIVQLKSGVLDLFHNMSADLRLREVRVHFTQPEGENVTRVTVDNGTETLASGDQHQSLLSINLTGGDLVVGGDSFRGCLIDGSSQGSGVGLPDAYSCTGVVWGTCPLEVCSDCDTCEVNPCDSSPCQKNGTCLPLVVSSDYYNSYNCSCPFETFDGVCTDQDYCDPNPCMNGTCQNMIDSFSCNCEGTGFTGDLCEVFDYCTPSPCSNGGTCRSMGNTTSCSCPLDYSGERCQCPAGSRGDDCSISTVLSFLEDHDDLADGSTLLVDFVDYTLSFRTSLPDGDLISVAGSEVIDFRLSLRGGTLQLFIDPKNGEGESVTVGQNLNDGGWHKVEIRNVDSFPSFLISVTVSESNIPSGEEDVCRDGICQKQLVLNGAATLLTFEIGGAGEEAFIGCMRDIRTGVFVDMGNPSFGSLPDGVENGCGRIEQCLPNTCANRGACDDLWWDFSCECDSGYTGTNCTEVFTVATFSFEDSPSYAHFDISSTVSSTTENYMAVQLQFRTRKRSGLIFWTELPNGGGNSDYMAIYLQDGDVHAKAKIGPSILDNNLTIGSGFSDGVFHFLSFLYRSGNVTLTVDGSASDSSIAVVTLPVWTSVQIGGVSEFVGLPFDFPPDFYFKGCIWDVAYNGYSLEFFPLTIPDYALDSVAMAIGDSRNVLNNSCASDDLCRVERCANNGSCSGEGLWNDYRCDCAYGYTGRNCSEESICHPNRNPCPDGAECIEIGDSLECAIPATFEVTNDDRMLRYTNTIIDSLSQDSISFRLRTRSGDGTIFSAKTADGTKYVTIQVDSGNLAVFFNLGEVQEHKSAYRVDDGIWHKLELAFADGALTVVFDTDTTEVAEATLTTNLTVLVTGPESSPILLAGEDSTTDMSKVGYIGCLDEFRIGGYLVPFLNQSDYSSNLTERFILDNMAVPMGCLSTDFCTTGDNDCVNGTCVDEWNQYSCNCTPGFEGELCSVNVDDCTTSPCENDGTCLDQVGDFSCLCFEGFEGKTCAVDTDDCSSSPCINSGTCMDRTNGFMCNCPEEYTGRNCEFQRSTNCTEDTCQNNSTCIQEEAGITCNCSDEFTGDLCAYPVDYCEGVVCQGGGRCLSNATIKSHVCNCVAGFEGEFCGVNIDDCADVNCNSGSCIDGVDSFQCSCIKGFDGPFCDHNIDDCSPNPCLAGTCQDGVDSFSCRCPDGYEGDRCGDDINECTQERPCLNSGTCENLKGSYRCQCQPSFFGTDCQFNPCLVNPCQNGDCTANNATSFSCLCEEGFEGPTCGVASCATVTSCENYGICIVDADGTDWSCFCPEFVKGDRCQYVGPCSTLVCLNNGTCIQDFRDDGFVGDGYCDCPVGFNDTDCGNEIDWCGPRPCENNATCFSERTGPTCTCAPGYAGDFCETELPDCSSSLCQNGATCTDSDFAYECVCLEGFNGTNCENNIDDCTSNECTNEGVCQDRVANYTCDCTNTGYTGRLCQTDINECNADPPICENNGTCMNINGSFKCECLSPYQGELCQMMVPCAENPCKNGGQCVEDDGSCDCTDNYSGPTCDKLVSPEETNWVLIGAIIGGVALLLLVVFILVIFFNIRKQRATAGTYSPSTQEMTGSRVEMDNVLKLPPPERLI